MLLITTKDLEKDLRIDPFVVDPNDPLGVYNLSSYIPEVIVELMDKVVYSTEEVRFQYADGTVLSHNHRYLTFNMIWWRILSALKLPILPEDFYAFDKFDENTLGEIHTSIQDRCLVPGADRKKILSLMYDSITVYYNFIHRYCCECAVGLDLFKLYSLAAQPDIREICDVSKLKDWSSRDIEEEINHRKGKLVSLLLTKYRSSVITRYLVTDTINVNQLVQMMIAYGPRSDINDKITGDPILHGTLDGFRSPAEFAVESLAAKKSAVYNKASVRESAYGNRQGHLTLCEIYKIDPVPCDNPNTVEMFMDKSNWKWFLGKTIVDNGVDVVLDGKNIKNYIDKPINMVSALDCRRRYSICSRCMGAMHKYIPSDMHLGLTTGAAVLSKIMQNILSAKHLVKTNTIDYAMSKEMDNWFAKRRDKFYLKVKPDVAGGYMVVPVGAVKNFYNINKVGSDENESTYSTIRIIGFLNANQEVVDEVEVEVPMITPFFSLEFIKYLINNKDRIKKSNGLYFIPLDKWDIDQCLFKIYNITFDMNAYVKSVQEFFSKEIVNYHDPGEALKAFCVVLYRKSTVNIFLAEILLKALMISSPTDYSFPIRDFEEPVCFGALKDVIDNRALTPKLAFEQLVGKDIKYLHHPNTYLVERPMGVFAPFFNLSY